MREMQVKHGAICHEISCILISLLDKLPPARVLEMLIWTVMSAHEADCHHTIVNITAVTTLHSVQTF